MGRNGEWGGVEGSGEWGEGGVGRGCGESWKEETWEMRRGGDLRNGRRRLGKLEGGADLRNEGRRFGK